MKYLVTLFIHNVEKRRCILYINLNESDLIKQLKVYLVTYIL